MSALTRFLAVLVTGALLATGLPAPPAVAADEWDPCSYSDGFFGIPPAASGEITFRVGCKKEWPEFGYKADPDDLITSLDYHGADADNVMSEYFTMIDNTMDQYGVPLGRAIAIVGLRENISDLKPEYVPEVSGFAFLANNNKSLVFIFRGEGLKKDKEDGGLDPGLKVVVSLIEGLIATAGAGVCKRYGWDDTRIGTGLCVAVTAFVAKTVAEVTSTAFEGKQVDSGVVTDSLLQGLGAGAFAGSGALLVEMVPRVTKTVIVDAEQGMKLANIAPDQHELRERLDHTAYVLGLVTRDLEELGPLLKEHLEKRDRVPPPPLRVMAIGDSITAGVDTENGDRPGNGYRSTLRDALVSMTAGGPVNFVGSHSSGTMTNPQHEGYPGRRIDDIHKFARCAVPRYRPNLIFLHAGTNDADQNYQIASASQRLKNLITQMLEDSPGAVVVVAELIPIEKGDLQSRVNVINAGLRTAVKELQDADKSVLLATTFDLAVADGLRGDAHPNPVGYRKLGIDFSMAAMRALAQQLLRAPGTPSPTTPGCDLGDGSGTALGEGWRALGVLAPGYGKDLGDTTMAELNGDHRADYMQVAPSGGMRAAYNTVGTPGHPKWVDAGTYALFSDLNYPPEIIGRSIKFADINGDGRDDAVYLHDNGSAAVRLNKQGANGGIEWIAPGYGAAPGLVSGTVRPDHVRFADMNGDGRDDYIRMGDDRSAHVYFNARRSDGAPYWIEKRGYIPGAAEATLANVRFADVDGDRKSDYLVVGPEGAVHAYLNRGTIDDAKFEQHLYWAQESGYDGANVRFYDISDDGKADYLVMYEQGSIRAWLNRGGNL